jgi:F-type H+-transporting ATPase subunit b
MIVGLSDAPDAVGAVGSTGTYLGLIRNIFIGFSVGASVVTARYIGAKDQENVSRSVHTAICMGVLFGVIGGGIGILLARPALTALGYEGSLLTLGVRYSYIYLACMPFLSLTNILCAILHARGDTKTSFYVLSGTGGLNILLNLFFVLVLKLTVSGVAIATAIANLASAVILWIILAKMAWPMIIKTLDAREEKITSDLQAAADAKEQAEQNVRSCDDRIAAAEREAQEIIAAAKREAENERTKIIAEAQASAVNIISKAHESIESERQKAMVELSGQVVDLSVEIAAKIIGDALDNEEQHHLAERYLLEVGDFNDE